MRTYIKNKYKESYCDYKLVPSRLSSFLYKNEDIKFYCIDFLNKHKEFETVCTVVKSILLDIYPNDCLFCKKPIGWINLQKKKDFCSVKCERKFFAKPVKKLTKAEIVEKRNKTIIKRYGVSNISKLESIKNKKKETCLKHYGVDNPNKSKIILDKRKLTFVEKYGVEYPMQLNEVKEKSKNTLLTRYGVTHNSQILDIKNKKRLQHLYIRIFKFN